MNKLLEQEISERKCVWGCISRIEESIAKCEYREAKLTAVDLLNSIRELERIEQTKANRTELERVIQSLRQRGILVEKASRLSRILEQATGGNQA